LTFYKGSFVAALDHLYPEIGLEIDKFSFFKQNAFKEWEAQKRRAFFVKFARKMGFDPLVLANWHSAVDSMKGLPVCFRKIFYYYYYYLTVYFQGLAWVTAPYKSQPLLALTTLFHEFELPNNTDYQT
jgi:hypothetical protein